MMEKQSDTSLVNEQIRKDFESSVQASVSFIKHNAQKGNTSTINVHLHHDHRLHGLVGDSDYSWPSLSLLLIGSIWLKRRSPALTLLI